jgi:serine/threonine protein kinase
MSSRKYDTKADIYSLGVILQELFNIDINEYLKYVLLFHLRFKFFDLISLLMNFFFFFIKSSVMTINNSLLNEKYNHVIKSICDMMSPMKSMRPTCEQLLNNKSLWALSVSDIQNDLMFGKFKNLSISESSIKNNFCNYFIKM